MMPRVTAHDIYAPIRLRRPTIDIVDTTPDVVDCRRLRDIIAIAADA